jgi:hypothetical protein
MKNDDGSLPWPYAVHNTPEELAAVTRNVDDAKARKEYFAQFRWPPCAVDSSPAPKKVTVEIKPGRDGVD